MIRGKSSFTEIKFHLSQREWAQVVSLCQQGISTDPQETEFYLYLAKAYAQQGKFLEAIDAYKKTLGTTIDQAEIYGELGLLHSKQKDLNQAAAYYRQALKLKPDWAELQYNLAVVLHQLGDWNGAIAAYNHAIKIKPDYAAAYFNLGVIYDQKGELDAAIAAYKQVIIFQPNIVRAYSNLGSTFARQQQYQLAIAAFKQGMAIDPCWATLHNNLGQVYWFDRQPGLALKSFEMAIVLEPTMALAHHNLGRLWQHQGSYAQALQCFSKVIELEPNNVLAYSNYADVQQTLGNLESTLNYWRKIIELEPDFVEAYYQGKSDNNPQDLLETAKLDCARFLQALKQENKTEAYHYLWRTYSYMGNVLFEFGGVKQAETYYQRALQIKPEVVELYLKLGNCLARQKRIDGAIAIYQQGLLLQPDHAQICFQLGKILERTQDAEQAINYYETVLNGQIEQAADWESLPNLFPTEDNVSLLPEQLYYHTQDWARDCSLEDFDYTQVLWSEEQSSMVKLEAARQPEAITITPGETSYPDCGGVNCTKCMNQLIKSFKPTQIGQNAYKCSWGQAPPLKEELPFVVTIPNGRAWIAPQKNSWVICHALAVITPDNYLLRDLSRDYPWFLPGCPDQQRAEHSVYQQENIVPVEKIEGRVALLSSLAGHVYYHWMFDIIPRLELLKCSEIKLQEIDWFVVNSLSKPFQKETLSLLGIPLEKIIESDRRSHIQAEQLIVPSFPGYLDWIPEGTMRFLRQTFLPQINLVANRKLQKIYVSRARSKHRRLINGEEVSSLLEQQGFKTIFLEDMSVLEQVAIFANAKVIIAPHGSGMTNLVFCSPNTKIIELFSPNYVRTDYWMISQQLQLQHYYVVGRNFNCPSLRNLMYQNALTEDILVDINALTLVLQHIQDLG